MTIPDLLRLVVVPVLGWAAWQDFRTRRVPNRTWYPLLALGATLLAWDAYGATGASSFAFRLFAIRVAISLGLVIPLAYAFWWTGLFGGADRKALIALAVLLPTFPTFEIVGVNLPLTTTTLGVFSVSVLTNGVIAGLFYPAVTAIRNAATGQFSIAMFVGRPVSWTAIPTTHGRLLETPEGLTRQGLDLDALRMYLRWRGSSLEEIREQPDQLRNPSSLPTDPHPPTDGAVDASEAIDPRRTDGGVDHQTPTDPWGAMAFLDAIEGNAYGTSPEMLRDGLDVLVEREVVWVSPGIPFLVPLFVGLLVALVYGDVLFAILSAVGMVS